MESSSEVYEMSDAALISFLLKMFAEHFIKMCANDIQWGNLLGDVVMEIGFGAELSCCKAILKLFPHVKILIEVNEEMTAFRRRTIRDRRVGFHIGSILNRFVYYH
ncbi:hypothetical protein TNCT_537071 [Trichonephila clavata]|uniref:Uncharacterized protein n=1 Tax=Trichonephila clavata TaxID=2740835 RepID=A0A8X6GBU9_TRICU|nr:hypothetical protein TNCT_537071 [Trichonephila clavata]